MTKQEIIDVLEKDISCEEELYCKTDCENCGYYVTRHEIVEAHKEILKLLDSDRY